MTDQERADIWQELLRWQQAYAEFTQAWMRELSGSHQAGLARDQKADPSHAPAKFGKQWIDLLQQFSPLPRFSDELDTAQNPFAATIERNPFLSALVQSSQQRHLLDGLQREGANHQQKLLMYQSFCSEVVQESMQRVSKQLEQDREIEDGRKLFDMWIDTAEEVYAEKTQDENFETLIGDLVNAMTQVRRQYNLISEDVSAAFNLPARGEIGEIYENLSSVQSSVRHLEAQIEGLKQRLEIVENGVVAKKSPTRKMRNQRDSATFSKKRKTTP